MSSTVHSSAESSDSNKNLLLDSRIASLSYSLQKVYLDYSQYIRALNNQFSQRLNQSLNGFQDHLASLKKSSISILQLRKEFEQQISGFHNQLCQLFTEIPFTKSMDMNRIDQTKQKYDKFIQTLHKNLVQVAEQNPLKSTPSTQKYSKKYSTYSHQSNFQNTDSNFSSSQNQRVFSLFSEQTEALVRQGRLNQALAAVEKRFSSKKGYEYYFLLGNIYKATCRYREAIESYSHAISIHPNKGCFYNNRGNCFLNLGETKKAYEDFRTALTIQPKNDIYMNNIGNTLLNLGDYLGALKQFNAAIDINSQNDAYFNNRAYAEIKLSKTDDALLSYREAIARNPTSDLYYKNVGNLFYQKQDFESALEYYSRAASLNPDHAEYHFLEGKAYYKLNRIQDAIGALGTAVQLDPNQLYRDYYNALIQQREESS